MKSNLEVIQEQINIDSEASMGVWVSIQEASLILNLSESTIFRRMKAGTLQRRRVGKRVQVAMPTNFHASAVDESVHSTMMNAWIEQLKIENTFLRSQIQEVNTANIEMRRMMNEDRSELNALRERFRTPPNVHSATADTGTVSASALLTQEGIREIVRLRLSQIQRG